jgi:ribonucleoside-diphosphate reductase alpha chain
MLYKDACNKKSNQKNIGIIRSSNLCAEIIQYSDANETSVCNLASMCLPSYIEDGVFNFEKLHKNVKVVTKNINKIIDNNFYPTSKTKLSNLKHRPMGIGVQGLADTFMILRLPFESDEAKELNKKIFATIYHAALEYSTELAKKRHEMPVAELYNSLNEYEKAVINTKYPGAYLTFEGSPASKGLLQFDLWEKEPDSMYDWNALKQSVMTYGLRNSLFVALMPTASTSSIMGFNEAFEPVTNNIYKRRVLSGEFIMINKYLINDLISMKLWNKDMKEKIMVNDGSVQNIDEIPNELKELYKTCWEMKQKNIIDMALDRSIYVCQSQSLNIFMEEPNFKKLTSMHFYSWSSGSKISNYYIRTRAQAKIQKFTIDPAKEKEILNKNKKPVIECNDEVCLVCSS